jgi:hypothetical protein
MLVQINTEVGGVTTDDKGRFFNFMASLYAVATAAAGSTPTVNPVITTTGLKNSSYNCITVLSNAEAGGWTAANSNNITPATTYNASFSSGYAVDLFNYSGKTTYPYYRMTFSNSQYFFGGNSQFPSYTWLDQWCGHTSLDPSTTAYTSDTSYYNGTYSGGRNPGGGSTLQGPTSYPNTMHLQIAKTAQTIYVAVTSTYMIISTPYDIFYFGQRTIAPWELTRSDNPPWVTFGWGGGQAQFPQPALSGQPYASHYQAWSSTVSPEGSYTTSPRIMGYSRQYNSYSSAPNILCQTMSGSTNSYTTANGNYLQPATHPLMHLMAGFNSSYPTVIDGVLTDSATGQTVPAAYPLLFRAVTQVSTGNANTGTQSAIGVFQGILRGPSTTNLGFTTMMTSSEYQIGTSTYVPIRVNSGYVDSQDCFWVRKA